MLSEEEIENKISLKDRTKYAIKKAYKIIKEDRNSGGECSLSVSFTKRS